MKMGVKNALRDWRLPAIFAIPVLLWAGLLYLVLQPLPGSGASASSGNVSITMNPTPSPWHQVNGTPYPSVAPPPKDTSVPCAHTAPTVIVVYNSKTHEPINAWVGTVCKP